MALPAAAWVADSAAVPLAMLLVFGSAKLFSEVFERFRQPGIVGEILAGIVIGPSVLDWIEPNNTILAFAELGLMFLLFRVGLQVKASEFARIGGTAGFVATLGVIIPFVCGSALALGWGHSRMESIFVGAALVATSVGITAQVLSAKGHLQARASKVILAAAVIDDILGLLVLAVVSSLAEGGINYVRLASTAVLAIGFTIVVARWGTRAMKVIVPRLEQRLTAVESQFALAMCLLFALSLLAVYAGVAAIIGAFLAGMALAETVGQRVHDLSNGVAELLVPFFLVSIGLRFNLSAFSSGSTILFAFILLAVAAVSKLIGCGLAAAKLGRADALRIGIGMIPRGEVGMVVAQIGLAMTILSDAVFGVIVFMSVMTTMIAPPLLSWVYKGVPARFAEKQDVYRIG
jgi:Kef-type K+ transport system membrane component KefB